MATRRWILSLLSGAMIAVLPGCSSGTFNVQNPPPPPPSKLSIAYQPAPVGSILINATTDLTAVVSNDPSNAGVDWSVTCSNTGNCGSLSSQHTASGQAATYTPPLALSGNSQAVNIVAFATADHTKNTLASINVTAFGSALKTGSFVLQAQGGANGFPYQFAAVIALDGNGGIASGEQTVNFSDPTTGLLVSRSYSIIPTGSSYFLGPDGRGTITINTADLDIDPDGKTPETFSFVFLNSSQALITQFPSTSPLQASASGSMDFQTWTTSDPPLSGGYAFAVSGTDIASLSPTAFGGIFNIDSPNNISGKGSVADQNLAGTLTADTELSGTLSNPDSFGAFALNLTVPSFLNTAPIQFTGYIVDGTHIKLIESDNSNPTSSPGFGSTAGLAIGQASATGTLTSFSGTYVFGVFGVDFTANLPSTLTSVGLFNAVDSGSGTGNLTNGFTDTFLLAYSNPVTGSAGDQISGTFSGTYSDAPTGTGRSRAFFGNVQPHPGGGFHADYIFYQTGNGNPALVLASANNDQATPLFLGAGIAYPQSAPPFTFGGDYGFSFTQQNGLAENDGTAQMTNPTAGNFLGSADVTGGATLGAPFSFSPTATDCLAGTSNGCFAGTFSNVNGGSAFNVSPMAADFYIIDSSPTNPGHGFFVETDLVNPGTGQVSFGYYAPRTPVCDGCP